MLHLLKKYGKPNKQEWTSFAITVAVITLIIGLDDGRSSFHLGPWLGNFILMFIAAAITVFVHHLGHRIAGLHVGFRVEYSIWWYGILISLMLAIVSRGKLWFLIPGGIMVYWMPKHRIGRFRYGPNMYNFSMICLMGPIANILLATMIKTIDVWFGIGITEIYFFDRLFFLNWAYAIFNLLPIPPLDGSRIFFHSRLIYAFVLGSIGGYGILVYVFRYYSFIAALLIGVAVWFTYWLKYEK